MKTTPLLPLLFFLCLGPGTAAQTLYFPPVSGAQWDTVSPASLGWNTAAIDPLYALLDSSHTRAFIVLKDGKIALEKYFGTFTKDSLWYWASAGKSMTSVLIGIAQQEGFLSISDTSSRWLGKGWTSETAEQEARITVRHQLTMTTGLEDGVPDKDCTLSGCLTYKADAGTRWAYHNGPYTLLDSVLRQSTGLTLNQFYFTRIRTPLGMNGAYLRSGDYNNVLYTTPRSMARFGLFILNRGAWGTTPILTDTAYFSAMTGSSQGINPSYGYLWWLNGKSSYMLPSTQLVFPGFLVPPAPGDMVSALGKNGQIINVVPSLGLVLVRMGDAPDNSLVPAALDIDIWNQFAKVLPGSSGVAIQGTQGTPEGFSLSQNYPNPFNPTTTIVYRIAAPADVRLGVFDLLGREVALLVNERQGAGRHEAIFDAEMLSGGVYFYRLSTGDLTRTQKMILLR